MKRRQRHISVSGHRGIYYSINSGGKKVYEVRFRDTTGRDHFKVVRGGLKDALQEQANIKSKLHKGVRAHYEPRSFAAVAMEWTQHKYPHISHSTGQKYTVIRDNFLIPYFKAQQIRTITTDQVAAFIVGLKTASGNKMSPSYAQGIYMVLYQILEFASNDRRGYIPKNPCDSLEMGERPSLKRTMRRAFTADEAKKILAASPDWLRPIILTGMYAGLRPSEIVALRWDDIDFGNDLIHVRFQLSATHEYVPTKGKESRDVNMLPSLRSVLFALPTRFVGGYVFEHKDKMVTYDHARQAFNRARDKAGIDPKLTLHNCRHTYASALLRDGGKDVTWVSSQLGHRSPRVTLETYAHVIQRENRNQEADDRLSEALGDLG